MVNSSNSSTRGRVQEGLSISFPKWLGQTLEPNRSLKISGCLRLPRRRNLSVNLYAKVKQAGCNHLASSEGFRLVLGSENLHLKITNICPTTWFFWTFHLISQINLNKGLHLGSRQYTTIHNDIESCTCYIFPDMLFTGPIFTSDGHAVNAQKNPAMPYMSRVSTTPSGVTN